jgi:hypothetical protein
MLNANGWGVNCGSGHRKNGKRRNLRETIQNELEED